MARTSRASAVAAARKIAEQVGEDEPRGMRRVTAKRKREELSEYEDDDNDDDNDEVEDAEEAIKEEITEEDTKEELVSPTRPPTKKKPAQRRAARHGDNAVAGSKKLDTAALCRQLFGVGPDRGDGAPAAPDCCCPPERRHGVHYHRPLLLDGPGGRAARGALLAWYDGVSAARGMPWRRPWVHPAALAGAADAGADAAASPLARRAYEVWISEVMAQQTRIAVVVDYWTRWMARWPTVADLAAAPPADVVAAWRGLGYYSRAARLHAAARALVADPDPARRGLLPADAAALQARVAGVGRYTAGAVSAIVFGRAAAMVDGNVVRVLSRQMGLYAAAAAPAAEDGGGGGGGGGGLSQKTLADLIWAAAEALVAVVARDDDKADDSAWAAEAPLSDRPGRWGQALMELGSTVCTPSPNCGACPIQTTCRAYGEGLLLHAARQGERTLLSAQAEDDACPLCEPFPEVDAAAADDDDDNDGDATAPKQKRRKTKAAAAPCREQRSAYFDVEDAPPAAALPAVVGHARLFPLRRPKKPVRVVETLVCAVRAPAADGRGWAYLLQQRPAKGLLAGLWQLPSHDLPGGTKTAVSETARRRAAETFVRQWWATAADTSRGRPTLDYVAQLGSVPWLFSHIRQTMHVYLFAVTPADGLPVAPASACWASAAEAEDTYTMGTGMRKCWHLLRDAE